MDVIVFVLFWFRLLRYLPISLFLFLSISVQAQEYSLDMRDTDIVEFIATVSKLTGKTIITDPRVKGKVTIRSPNSISAEELYEIFLVQLGVNGYAVVSVGDNLLKVVPQPAVKLEGIEVQGDSSEAPKASENIVTRVVQVNNVDVGALVPVLRPLVDNQTGIIAPYPASNVILITDRESNVRRLLEIIARVDKTETEDTEIIQLKNASAREVSQTLTTLIREQMKSGEGSRAAPMIAADTRTNSLLIRADEAGRNYLQRIIRQLDNEVKTDSNTRVYYLKYAKATDLVTVLESIGNSIIEGDNPQDQRSSANRENIHIKAHEATNSIVMSGSPRVIISLNQVIEQLDIRRAQVMVEAIIVEMSETRAKELGIQWLLGGEDNGRFGAAGTNFSNLGNSLNALTAEALDDTSGLASALSGVEGVSFGVGRVDSSGLSFAVLLKALQNDSDSNILSTPSLVTMDNEEASILVGREVPIVTGQTIGDNNSNPFQTISREDVGIKLKVTPQVNDGSAVQLKIEQEVSSLTGITASDIITDKREIKTAVMVDDGATIVLGGLIDDDVQEVSDKVPGLGNVPVVGRLFRSDSSQISRRNLMVFIRPTIIRDRRNMTEVTSSKYSYLRARQLLDNDRSIQLFPGESPTVLPEWAGMGPSSIDILPPPKR
ncbi:general secretion pathway protein D [Marinobacterium stanieri]|uniref:General secretion pathway protein D n=2 Tax=Marinobacterium stanieri TaxID=49186 RepID=A0A1N6XJ91_9GAMM|nr:general secretion pathway protein D [Marinobacterium stanieri]